MKDIVKAYALQNAIKFDGKASESAVLGKILKEKPELKKKISEIRLIVSSVINEINSMSLEHQKQEYEKYKDNIIEVEHKKKGLKDLPNVKGKVVMRIAPYPSGPLQLGNAKQLILNDEYVKKYGGDFLFIIDDTIGSEEKNILPEAYDLILDGAEWLGCNYKKPVIYKSDRLEIYYKYALDLIKKGKAYVCFCDALILRKNRMEGKECEHRSYSVKENQELWLDMLDGKYDEGEATLRLKTDMQHKDPAFRDRVLFRICKRQHPRVGNRYCVWPLLEFSWAVDDHLLQITHILRGKDLMMESMMEKYIWDIFGWKHAELIHTGLLSIEGIKISKSKSKKEVLSGQYFGWDDPRTWSLQSLKRRGILPEAIRAFILEIGVTQNDISVPIETLYSENKKLLDGIANRYFFIENPVKIKIKNAPEQAIELDLHPTNRKSGRLFLTKENFYIQKKDYDEIMKLKEGNIVRLMDCLNFTKHKENFIFISREYDKENTKKIIHWLSADEDEQDLVDVEILMPDSSLIKGKGEKHLVRLTENEIIQFERFGFCKFQGVEKGVFKFWFAHQ